MQTNRRRFVAASVGVGSLSIAGSLSRIWRDPPRLVYVHLVNWQPDRRTLDLAVNANGKSYIDAEVTLESIEDTEGARNEAGEAPYKRYVAGEWPERGTYEVIARLDGVDRSFRTTQRGIEPGSHFGISGAVHPGREVIGWFVETIDSDELDEYRNWLDKHGVTR